MVIDIWSREPGSSRPRGWQFGGIELTWHGTVPCQLRISRASIGLSRLQKWVLGGRSTIGDVFAVLCWRCFPKFAS